LCRAAAQLSALHQRARPVLGIAPERVLDEQLAAAREILACPPSDSPHDSALSDELERIRWFALPSEALAPSLVGPADL
jgi:hypothetical protein